MSLIVPLASMILTGFSVSWSSLPAQSDCLGSAEITVTIEGDDLLEVAVDDCRKVSWEITATVDGEGFIRQSGTMMDSSFPVSEVIEFSSLEPGGHTLSVTLADLETGTVRQKEMQFTVDQCSGDLWSSSALLLDPSGPVRASGYLGLSWSVYIPEDEELTEAAYAFFNDDTSPVREGWLQRDESVEGSTALFAGSIPLNGLNKGVYRVSVAALDSNGMVASSSSSSIRLLEAWDLWGVDPDVTETLIRPIATVHELRELEQAGGLGDRNSVMADFWGLRDPIPATRENEYLQEYLLRLDKISREFATTGISGINTDRGIVYAKLGEPDIVEEYPFEIGAYPYIRWEYFTPALTVSFVDYSGYGFYELAENWETVDRAFNAGEEWAR
ncbi:hypothetical protein CSA37_02320 [Candidatus Fermentibacteria bacterium]|nr:MAG: hypothetical protein CSA37_02320 [Candidatus Fermentibacteria bacterium]